MRTWFRNTARSVFYAERLLWPAVVVGLIVAGTALLIGEHRESVGNVTDLAAVSMFLFGVLLAFTTARMRERIVKIHDLLRTCDAELESCYEFAGNFGEDFQREVQGLIDAQLIDQVDYRLVEFWRSADSHKALTTTIYNLEPKGTRQTFSYRALSDVCWDMTRNRALIEAVAGQELSKMEWTSTLLLLLLILCLMTILPGGTIAGSLLVGFLAMVLVSLVGLVRQLERLRWHERTTIWEPQARLFRSLGLLPYIPRSVIEARRYRPTGVVRIVDYHADYPDRSKKTVSEVDLG
jgi:hypothetical protein